MEIDPHLSGTGRFVSFVREGNLAVIDLPSGRDAMVTPEAPGPVSWGTAEFVAQEEMGRYTGQWWAPEDSRLAVQRTVESDVELVTHSAIRADGAKVYEQRYPRAGTPNAKVELWLMRPDGGGRAKVDLGADADI